MKFLLVGINAKYIHSNPAIRSLRAYAGKELAPFVEIAEYTINHSTEEILRDLYAKKPDAIGFSCYIWNWEQVKELLWELPKVLPHTQIWLGGPEVSFASEKLLSAYPSVRGIMTGEGEETFRELLSFYIRKVPSELSKIKGLLLREGFTGQRELTDLNALPFLYENLEELSHKIIYYESSRGCPFRCSYCLSSIDKQVRLRDIALVKKELSFFLQNKAPQVKFIDRTFNCRKEHAMEIWRYLKEQDNGVTNFHFEIAAELLGEEELALLEGLRPGLVQLEIGVQSTNRETLREIRRPGDIFRIEEAVRRLRKNRNIHIHLDLIAGLPFEDLLSFQNSFNQVYAMEPDQLQLGFLKVLKGTLIRERAEDYGLLFRERPPYEVLSTRWLSYEEILLLKRIEEMVELYYNSGQFVHTMPALLESFETPFAMYRALADYYEKKGYLLASPARIRRYEALLSFVTEEVGTEKEGLFRELLTLDFYAREKAKSRPSFACDLAPFYDRIWEFYQKEEKTPMLLKGYEGYHARQLMKMTHMEVFYELAPLKESGEPCFVLFDYKERDALTGNARLMYHPMEIKEVS